MISHSDGVRGAGKKAKRQQAPAGGGGAWFCGHGSGLNNIMSRNAGQDVPRRGRCRSPFPRSNALVASRPAGAGDRPLDRKDAADRVACR
jgi:hypothetical protein